MAPEAARERLLLLRTKADAFFRTVQAARPAAVTCRAGCTACCAVDLTVFPVEAAPIAEAFRRLPADVRAAAAERARAGQHCALLDPDDGRCVVYEEHPLLCRTHGLAVRMEGRTSHCGLNYRDERPALDDTLALDRLNVPLALLDHLAGGDGRRVRLADLAGERAGGGGGDGLAD